VKSNKEKNRQILEKELGFEDGVYYHISGQPFAIVIYDSYPKVDVLIALYSTILQNTNCC
jgi:hypothetical protein